ncbi:MAG: SagB/ThcOx family dehydrogenase [Candidatus Omnitrophica bacterium]|nr:SagB/ThcOx family dehydrogenase [Candidatus Omnitrophota bacterium]
MRGYTAILVCVFLLNPGGVMAGEIIQLPDPATKGKISLEEAILKRRSQRRFIARDLTFEQISQLLWAAQGITAKKGNHSLRSAPSAGALYPIEIYLLTKDGLYHYLPEGHRIEQLSSSDLRIPLANSAFGQGAIVQAPVNVVVCAVYRRVTSKYGERGRQYVDIEVGHVAQNLHLEATALGLGSVPIGAFDNSQVKKILSLGKEEEPVYIIPIGYTG